MLDMYIDNTEPSENVGQIHFSIEYDFQNTTLILKIMQVSKLLKEKMMGCYRNNCINSLGSIIICLIFIIFRSFQKIIFKLARHIFVSSFYGDIGYSQYYMNLIHFSEIVFNRTSLNFFQKKNLIKINNLSTSNKSHYQSTLFPVFIYNLFFHFHIFLFIFVGPRSKNYH